MVPNAIGAPIGGRLFGKRLPKNINGVFLQVVTSGAVLFILYRYLYQTVGVEQIGIWSLVISMGSVSRLIDLGLSSSVVKFVAQALGSNDYGRANNVVQTALITLAILEFAVLVVGYWLVAFFLGYFLSAADLSIARSILPYIIVWIWITIIVSVLNGALDGCLRMDIRGKVSALFQVVYLGAAFFLTPAFGLKGLAIAQLIQVTGLLFSLWWLLRRQIVGLPLIPLQLRFVILKEMIAYGFKIQITSIMNFFFDPVVKALMSKLGGLESLGYYGMANGFVLQARALIVETSRIIVPTAAGIYQRDAVRIKHLFMVSYRLVFFVSALFFGVLGISIPTVCLFWLGMLQETFIQFSLLLTAGWFINTLIGPAYFLNLGSGSLRNNVISDTVMGLLSPLCGLVLGLLLGGVGVIVGMVLGLTAGSSFLLISYAKQLEPDWIMLLLPKGLFHFSIFVLTMVGVSNLIVSMSSSILMVIVVSMLSAIALLLVGWRNPVRIEVMNLR